MTSEDEAAERFSRTLRENLMSELHMGHRDREVALPSIRRVAGTTGLDHRVVASVYHALAAEGLIEVRDRAGMYLATMAQGGGSPESDEARWVARLLADARGRDLRIPELADLIRGHTCARPVRCALIESTLDYSFLIGTELRDGFGLTTQIVDPATVTIGGDRPAQLGQLPAALRHADVIVATAFHAPAASVAARVAGRPLLLVTMNRAVTKTLEHHLLQGPVTVICEDTGFADRQRALYSNSLRDRLGFVLAADAPAVAAVDRSHPVFLTRAAHHRLGDIAPLAFPPGSPAFSPASIRDLAGTLVRLNTQPPS